MENSMSPSPKSMMNSKTMTFVEAILYVLDGKRIHKLEWGNKEFYGVMENKQLMLHKPDDKTYGWLISEEDLTGIDYIILPEAD